MVIFIDESGTHKQSGKAAIALVYVEVKNLEPFEQRVKEIERELELRYFHWTDESWEKREKFIMNLLVLDFTFKVAILENPVKLSKSIEDTLRHLVVEENITKIVIDGRKPKWYSLKLKKVLRDKEIPVKKIVTIRKEESSPGIRVADCLAGLMRYYHNNPESTVKNWYKRLKMANKIHFEFTTY